MVMKASGTPTPLTIEQQLALLVNYQIWFGHQSVGNNIMHGTNGDNTNTAGLAYYINLYPAAGITNVYEPSSISQIPAGTFGDGHIGSNQAPSGKITAFQNGVITTFGGNLDYAFMKFCWYDFGWNGSEVTTEAQADSLFTSYQNMVSSITSGCSTILLHCTVPLTYRALDAYNSLREYYNDKVRTAYSLTGRLFDIADWQSRDVDGNQVLYNNVRELNSIWNAGDGGHMNADGCNMMAKKLLNLFESILV